MKILHAIVGFLSGLAVSVIFISCGLFATLVIGGAISQSQIDAVESLTVTPFSSLVLLFEGYLVLVLLPTILGLVFLSPLILLYYAFCILFFRFLHSIRSRLDLPLAWLVGALICAAAAELVLWYTGWGIACRDSPAGLWCLLVRTVRKAEPVPMFFVFAASGVLAGVVHDRISGRS